MESKKYKFHTKKVENILGFAIMALFIVSMTDQKNFIFSLVFYAITILCFVYYFVWYKKRPPYVIVSDNEITVHNDIFYKPTVMKKENIKGVQVLEKKIEFTAAIGGIDKKVNILYLLLEDKDKQELINLFSPSEGTIQE